MAQSIIKRLNPSLPKLCNLYKSKLGYACAYDYEIRKTLKFRDTYIGNFIISASKIDQLNLNELCVSKTGWLMTLRNLSPQTLTNKIDYKQLLTTHKNQMKFYDECAKIIIKMEIYHTMNDDFYFLKSEMYKMICSYAIFLDICLQNKGQLIIPTVAEDFVWHAHMVDNKVYVNDMNKVFGSMLHHNQEGTLVNGHAIDYYKDNSDMLRKKYYKKHFGDVNDLDFYWTNQEKLKVQYDNTTNIVKTSISDSLTSTIFASVMINQMFMYNGVQEPKQTVSSSSCSSNNNSLCSSSSSSCSSSSCGGGGD